MWNEAVAWAESVLGTTVTDAAALRGGLTSTMLRLSDDTGRSSVLRLMTEEPWRTHGAALTTRERAAQLTLTASNVLAPTSLGLDAEGTRTGVAAHLMSHLPGHPTRGADAEVLAALAEVLAVIHDVAPDEPFRRYQSWAPPATWVVPGWTRHSASWERAFAILAQQPPPFEPTFLHRDYSHRNVLWQRARVVGVVDSVETSCGPAWLDAAHAATNLAVSFGAAPASAFLSRYAALTGRPVEPYWLVMDAVGFLPSPGGTSLFSTAAELEGLDEWLDHVASLA